MECHICQQCLQNCVEPCLGENWKRSKENQRNPSSSCIPCKSGRLIKCSICRIDLDLSNKKIQKLPFEDMMKYLQTAHSAKKKHASVSQSYNSPKNLPKSSSCPADLNMSNQEIQKLPYEDMMKYFQIAYSKKKQNSFPQSYISPTNSSSNSPKYSPIMGARKFIMSCFSPNNSPRNSPKNSPKNTRNPLQTIQEYERHDLVLYNVNNKYTCIV